MTHATASTGTASTAIVIPSIEIGRGDRCPMIAALSTTAHPSIRIAPPTARTDRVADTRTDRDRDRLDGDRPRDRQDMPLDGDGNQRPADDNRGDRRTGDDPFSSADGDSAPRRRDRRRTDDRTDLRQASDSTDDLAQATIEENQWLSSLPSLTDELRQLALKAFRKTRPERRRELTRRLSSGSVPDLIRKTLQEWIDGPPASATSAGGSDDERSELERGDRPGLGCHQSGPPGGD